MIQFSKYKLLIGLTAFLLFFSSCKKSFLEKLPPTALPPEVALATEADLQVALRGAYAGLRVVDYFGRTVPVIGDVMADNAYVHAVNTGRYTQFNTYTWVVNDGNVTGFWRGAYTTILRANNIINSTIASSANVNQYKGEAYAIRALCYFYLVRFFARPYTDDPNGLGVPIILTYAPDLKPTRSKISEVYTQIISDLSQAFTLMTQYSNSTQFSKYAARGLQAKVYMTMNDKANAKTAALDVINNGGFLPVVSANYLNYWSTLLPRTDKLETLFEVSSDANANSGFDGLANIYNQSGYGDVLVADDLYAMFAAGDIRKSLYTVGLHQNIPGAINANNKYPGTFGSDISDTKILRLSEMYLIAAEASLPTDEAGALTYVNFITSRRGAAAITSTGAQLFEDIITERRKELAFEGDRILDLNRLKRDVVRGANFPASARTIPYANTRRILPIPQAELDANPNIRGQQNPGY